MIPRKVAQILTAFRAQNLFKFANAIKAGYMGLRAISIPTTSWTGQALVIKCTLIIYFVFCIHRSRLKEWCKILATIENHLKNFAIAGIPGACLTSDKRIFLKLLIGLAWLTQNSAILKSKHIRNDWLV
jgi:hypothetical protein